MTGFGKFGDVVENPTTFLVNALQETVKECEVEIHLEHSEVVDVSIQDCDVAIESIYKKIAISAKENPEDRHIVMNLGVAARRPMFCLEAIGKNIKDFRFPDERGNQPLNEPIRASDTTDFKIECSLDLDKACTTLITKGHNVQKSHDAGEYICNYTYFRSLECIDNHNK